MNFVFEIDRQRLLDGSTGAPIASLQFSYPDKYPVTISITRGNQPHPVTGTVYITLKPASTPLSPPLALLTIPVNNSATATGILDTYIQEMDAWLPAANKRAAQFEVLVVSTVGGTEVSVDVPAQVSRRYNSVDQPGVTVAEKSLATQAEAEAGTNNTKWMSPLRVAQAISHLAEFADTTDELSEGTTNLYFTDARAKAALADELSEIGSDITELGTAIDNEEAARISGDQSLAGGLNDVITALAGKQPAGSYATLDGGGKVPASQLPSYVDDVLEFANLASLPVTGETGKIYVALDTRRAYRWTGSQYLEISPSEVTSVAGKTGAVTLSKSDVGLDQVNNTSDADKPVSTAQQTALDAKQNLRTTVSFTLQEGDNYLPVSRNTLYLLSGSFTTATIYLPTFGSLITPGARVGDRIRIVWSGVKSNANSRINVIAFAGDGQYPSLAQLHDQDQAAEFVLDPIPRNASGQLTWRADVDPIRWVQPPATPSAFVAANGAAYSPSDVAFDGSHFYIYGKKPDGTPVWLRTPMTATW